MTTLRNTTVALLLSLFVTAPAYACDPCALYSASRLYEQQEDALLFSLSDQYTDYEKSARNSLVGAREAEQTTSYRTTQLSLGYGLTERTGLDLTVPFVFRRVNRTKDYRTSDVSESGIGDIVLSLNTTPLQIKEADFTLITGLFGGIKLPTGDTGSIPETTSSESLPPISKHHPVVTSSGGRVLVEGSGSFDFPFGAAMFVRKGRSLLMATGQYTVRTEGDYNYEFANDFVWDFGPGYYITTGHELSLAGRVVLSGEHKPTDRKDGVLVDDSAVSNVYLGPQLLIKVTDNLSVDVRFDKRISNDNTDSILPDYRVRSGLTWLF